MHGRKSRFPGTNAPPSVYYDVQVMQQCSIMFVLKFVVSLLQNNIPSTNLELFRQI